VLSTYFQVSLTRERNPALTSCLTTAKLASLVFGRQSLLSCATCNSGLRRISKTRQRDGSNCKRAFLLRFVLTDIDPRELHAAHRHRAAARPALSILILRVMHLNCLRKRGNVPTCLYGSGAGPLALAGAVTVKNIPFNRGGWVAGRNRARSGRTVASGRGTSLDRSDSHRKLKRPI
jgi:hypothetical protein